MIWGFNVSSIDLPSLKNSGFVKNPKPFPLDFCENFSSNGNRTVSEVSGITVLLTIMRGLFLVFLRFLPISTITFL